MILQIKESVTSNAQQAKQLLNEAKQLMSLPMDISDEIMSTIGQYYEVLNQGQGLAYRATDAVRQFEDLYQAAVQGGNVSMMERLQAMSGQIRNAARIAQQVQALYEQLCGTQSTVQRLVAASQQAEGQKQVAQAQTQMLAVLSAQQSSLQELLAANGRLQLSVYMQGVIETEAAQQRVQDWLSGFPTGAGEGFKLP